MCINHITIVRNSPRPQRQFSQAKIILTCWWSDRIGSLKHCEDNKQKNRSPKFSISTKHTRQNTWGARCCRPEMRPQKNTHLPRLGIEMGYQPFWFSHLNKHSLWFLQSRVEIGPPETVGCQVSLIHPSQHGKVRDDGSYSLNSFWRVTESSKGRRYKIPLISWTSITPAEKQFFSLSAASPSIGCSRVISGNSR